MYLALDSVFSQCSVALLSDKGEVLSLDTQAGKRAQTQQILPMIKAALEESQVKLSDITALIFNRGPGAFSGIRINTAVAQALSVAHDIPCVGVSSLQVLAQAALEQHNIAACYAVHDARMKQVYIARFAAKDGIMQSQPMSVANDIRPDTYIDNNIDTHLENNTDNYIDTRVDTHVDAQQDAQNEHLIDYGQPTLSPLPLVGDGAALLHAYEGQKVLPEIALDATIVASLGRDSYQRHGGVSAEQALPVYLRNHAWKTLKEQGKA